MIQEKTGVLAYIYKKECLIDKHESDAVVNYCNHLKALAESQRTGTNNDDINKQIQQYDDYIEKHNQHIDAVKNFLKKQGSNNKQLVLHTHKNALN